MLAVSLFSNCGHKVDDQDGIKSFLSLISLQIKGQQAEDLLKNFDMPKKKSAVVHLVKLLCNLSGVDKNSKPIFKVDLNAENDTLTSVGKGITKVAFPVKFSRDSIEDQASRLAFKIRKGKDGKYKVIDVEATKFSSDYVFYENLVRQSTLTDKDIYDPTTLAAFKTAEGLKGKYDSIPWFQHIGDKVYYFVVKGKLNADLVLIGARDTTFTYKMGMVDPDQKEIIPVEFDIVHNIGATFPDLVEVEKTRKRGFYNLSGQNVLPVEYDEILPMNETDNLALLRKGDDYFWLKKDLTLSEKTDVKIAEILPKIQAYGKSFDLKETVMKNVTECNSRENPESVYFPPSYLVDWHLMPFQQNFKNPLRRNVEYEDASELYTLKFEGKTDVEGWLSSVFYSITDHYLGGREGLYQHKNVLVVNKNKNRVYGADIQTDLGETEGIGSDMEGKYRSELRAISDSLYEIKVGSVFSVTLHDSSIVSGGPGYHYLLAKNDKLAEPKAGRIFSFTKYVKMDDSYLNDRYEFYEKPGSTKVNKEMLSFMKNEIYGEYRYKFKDPFWATAFMYQFNYGDKAPLNDNVDDSLTVIDKYNIAFINKKLQQQTAKPKVLAAK